MKTKLMPLGRSLSVRLPKKLVKQANLTNEVEVSLLGDSLVIRSSNKKPRAGWVEALTKLAQHEQRSYWSGKHGNTWDDEEWEWE